MEVAIPSPTKDFNFNEVSPTSYLSAPSSPSRLAELYSYSNGIFAGEEEFAFTFRTDKKTASLSTADELFDGGRIKTVKPPPELRSPPPPPPKSPANKGARGSHGKKTEYESVPERGRQRTYTSPSSASRKGTRSLSPLRVSGYPWEEGELDETSCKQDFNAASAISNSSRYYSKSSTKKWSFKDLLLFRSASEGRSAERDPFRKYSVAALFRYKKAQNDNQEARNSSFRSTEGSVRKRVPMSAHEAHYTVNKAISENMKKKTFLPYKQGLLGRLAFNPGPHAL